MEYVRQFIDNFDCIIYHDPCMDGIGSAFITYIYYNGNIQLIPTKIGDLVDEYKYKNKNVLMVDIVTPDYEIIKELSTNLIILDHHVTNKDKLNGKDYAYFNMDKSGIGLVWEYFYQDKQLPLFLACLQDRDLWTWKIENSETFSTGLFNSMYLDESDNKEQYIINIFNRFNKLYEEHLTLELILFNEYLEIGKIFNKVKMSNIKLIVSSNKTLHFITINNKIYKVFIINYTGDAGSDIGNYVVNNTDAEFAILWRYNHETKEYYYSTRSNNNKVDVSEICKYFNGGGHRNAAGFSSNINPHILLNID